MFSLQQQLVVAAAALLVAALHIPIGRLKKRLERAEKEVVLVAEERRSERAGRTKAERELRELQLRLSQLSPAGDGSPSVDPGQPLDLQQVAFPLRPIGILRSCFNRRNGTPRQPLLVGSARARLVLRPDLSADYLQGLQQYSHVWVLYVFHCNTDLQRLWQRDESGRAKGPKAKIRVPRLDGERLGVFATRSPHRPCPIGLSVAQVVAVEGRALVLGGADIVDGSPVLDIKPYVPFCDGVPAAVAPAWVAAEAEDEPLAIAGVQVPPGADAQLEACWRQLGSQSLYRSYQEFQGLVTEVLSRDLRSVTQRVKVPARQQQGLGGLSLQAAAPAAANPPVEGALGQEEEVATPNGGKGSTDSLAEGYWHVLLDGVDITYEVSDERVVELCTARLAI